MASRKTKAAAAPAQVAPEAIECQPPNPLIVAMETTAALVERTLAMAMQEKVAITLMAGEVGVAVNTYGEVGLSGASTGNRGCGSWMLARQAGLFLGAARATAAFHDDDAG